MENKTNIKLGLMFLNDAVLKRALFLSYLGYNLIHQRTVMVTERNI